MVWRLLWLLRTIEESESGISAASLARDCELSERTVYRYIKILRLAGMAIETNSRGYFVNQSIALAAVNLNLPEAFSLMLASENMIGSKAPFSPTLEEATQKIFSALPAGLRAAMRDGKEHVLVERAGPIDYSKTDEIFKLVDAATKEHSVLSLVYRGIDDKRGSSRLVNPYGLMLRSGLWYLVAWCQKREEMRIFRLDRISTAQRTGEIFLMPTDFSMTDYMKDAWQVLKGEPVDITVRFSGRARRLILEGVWHDSQEVLESNDETTLVAFKIGGLREFAAWLIGFGEEAEVVEPDELRKLVFDIASGAAGVNKTKKPKSSENILN